MKTIGLIGGMSWESSAFYYRIINEEVKERLGGLHSAKCILYSVDFHPIEKYQATGQWEKASEIITKAAQSLQTAGADIIILCTNTMHKVFNVVSATIDVPMLHIAHATGKALTKENISRVGLLGTKYTMEHSFYKGELHALGFQVILPDENDINLINQIIFEELCLGEIRPTSREKLNQIINQLGIQGAEGIILGCTELGLFQFQSNKMPIFDTTRIHAISAVEYALA
ncbi:aspartate/glutamate racemase family protein [Salirhabdus salicampi]|uniref:aspartate/glutamate racemase family protein n=1 Tax=Salirhabdus salicampi TaxID=476102 RepID=UPI0020C3B985|nr:aspartate/glutamate racemase family protein [Salirhabdus salicampi]MCP8615438.1 aspartate/glutamate racemase family protein [Salirhabdus salicampi]